jgi:hypothetical protein
MHACSRLLGRDEISDRGEEEGKDEAEDADNGPIRSQSGYEKQRSDKHHSMRYIPIAKSKLVRRRCRRI